MWHSYSNSAVLNSHSVQVQTWCHLSLQRAQDLGQPRPSSFSCPPQNSTKCQHSFPQSHHSCLALQGKNFDVCPAVTRIQLWLNASFFLGMAFGCGSLANTSVSEERIRPITLNGKLLEHLPPQERWVWKEHFIFGIRQRAILDTTLDCNYQWCKAATHLLLMRMKLKPPKLEHSSIRRWQLHITASHTSEASLGISFLCLGWFSPCPDYL